MIGPIVVGIGYSLIVIVLSVLKPNAGRIVLGIFFLAMGLGVNLTMALTQPTFILEYGLGAWLPLYRTLTERIIGSAPLLFGVLLIGFEVLMGILLLTRGVVVKIGLVGTMVFVLALVPIALTQIAWAGSIAGHVYLLTRRFDSDVVTLLRERRRRRKNTES
jgi:hypothetical protein